MAFALVSLLSLLALQFAWRQRVDAHTAQRAAAEAEQRASLREHEARLAHASRVNAMGELASGIAHELTQPLTALLSQSQAALRLASVPKPDLALVSDILGANVREAKRAGAMIERMRAYVSNRQAEPARTSINGIVKDTTALISADFEKRGIRLDLKLSRDDPQAVVDPIEMEQVVHNLLRNAADALAAAGTTEPAIIVRTAVSHQSLTIQIEDNG
ncbi:sensor histidine kinase, partial [Rhizobiaceae sp. 2RAB30]